MKIILLLILLFQAVDLGDGFIVLDEPDPGVEFGWVVWIANHGVEK